MDILVFDKELIFPLTDYLSLKEYRCKCTHMECTRTLALEATIRSYDLVRKAYKKPIRINSAFRCQKHNVDVGGRANSYHCIGAAMDLALYGPFMKEELDLLDHYARLYFDVVLRYDSFIHCHNLGDERTVNIGEEQ